jgi:hypothetical protein
MSSTQRNGESSKRIIVIDKVGSWLESRPWWLFGGIVIGLSVIRTGPLPIGPEWVGWLRSAGQSLPVPSELLSSSLGPVGLMRVLGYPGDVAWWALGFILWLAAFGGTIFYLARFGALGRLIAIGVAASPAFAVTLSMLGHYDLWIIVGSAVVAVSSRRLLVVVGAVIATLGNPEQAVLSAIAVLLVAFAWGNRRSICSGAIFLGIATLGFVSAWFWVSGSTSDGRSGIYLGFVSQSIDSIVGLWPLAVYAWLGPLWIGVIFLLALLPRWWPRGLAFSGVIVLPGLMSMTTLDGTRVFVAVGTGALLSLVVHSLRGPLKDWQPTSGVLGGAAMIGLLTPSVIVDTGGTLRLPYLDWLEQLRG